MTVAPAQVERYRWPPSTEVIAERYGLDPSQVIRFDGNVPALPLPSTRPATVAMSLAEVNEYDRGGYLRLREAIARRHGVDVRNIVLAAGSDDLILLCARTFALCGRVATVPRNTYSMFRVAAELAQATIIDDLEGADLVFVCRPNNPTGELPPMPSEGRLLVVDEAYADYSGDSVVDRVDDHLIVLRTFSKAFGLAGARIGYAVASATNADILSARQAPLTVAAPSAALALAALADPPDVAPQIAERERLADGLRGLRLTPLPSHTNFVFVPMADPSGIADALLPLGLVVRVFPSGLRIGVRDPEDDDLLLAGLATILERPQPARSSGTSVRHVRATAETAIRVRLRLRGERRVHAATGCGLYDHLLEQLAFHAGLDLIVDGSGDLENGEHHTVEDVMRTVGESIDRALGDRRGVTRYGEARIPMDEAVAHAVIDISGRPVTRISIIPDPGLARHALEALAQAARITLHVESRGDDPHHVAEASFKAVGRAMAAALHPAGAEIASTKGVL